MVILYAYPPFFVNGWTIQHRFIETSFRYSLQATGILNGCARQYNVNATAGTPQT